MGLSSWEGRALWTNRNYFAGHTKWLVQLLRSIDWAKADVQTEQEMFVILTCGRHTHCFRTMCSRLCQERLGIEEALQALRIPHLPKRGSDYYHIWTSNPRFYSHWVSPPGASYSSPPKETQTECGQIGP